MTITERAMRIANRLCPLNPPPLDVFPYPSRDDVHNWWNHQLTYEKQARRWEATYREVFLRLSKKAAA